MAPGRSISKWSHTHGKQIEPEREDDDDTLAITQSEDSDSEPIYMISNLDILSPLIYKRATWKWMGLF